MRALTFSYIDFPFLALFTVYTKPFDDLTATIRRPYSLYPDPWSVVRICKCEEQAPATTCLDPGRDPRPGEFTQERREKGLIHPTASTPVVTAMWRRDNWGNLKNQRRQ